MRSFVVRGVALSIAVAIAAPVLALSADAEAQRRRTRRAAPSGAESADARTSADPQLDAEARGLFLAGREAFDAGRYDSALDHFTRAYALSGRPGLLFNIASTAERLRRDEEALRAYQGYLEALPDAPNREYAEARIVFLREQLRADHARQASVPSATVAPTPEAVTPAPPARPSTRAATSLEVRDEDHDEPGVAALQAPIAPGTEELDEGERRGGDVTQEWWFWTLVGVAVVGAGAGITAGVVASQSGGGGSPVQGDFGPGGVIVALEGN